MPFKKFKGGKLPPVHKADHVSLSDFLDKATVWPSVPAKGWEFAVNPASWGMLGNDLWGDCTCAGIYHLLQAQSANTGNPLTGTTEQALALYSEVTGFDPNAGPSGNNPTDNGAVLTDILTAVQKNGLEMTDATGKVVTVEIVGWAALDITSLPQTRYAAYTFGGTYEGYNLPEQCEQDTTNWNFAPGLPIAGGHCVPRPGQGADGGPLISWGMRIPSSNGFAMSYRDEGYVVISKIWLNAQGQSPVGLDLNSLVAAMQKFGAIQ
jgi:hypothetical protein